MSFLHILLVAAVGIAAGFINTVAGGGSLITLPVLIFLGLPSAVANGTNRVALMAQNIVAIENFRSKGYFDWKLSLIFAVPAAAGAVVGSRIAVSLSDAVFNRILAFVMVAVLILTVWNPQKRIKKNETEPGLKNKIIGAAVFFGVGIYGGFIQAGIGFVIIAALTLITGYSLVKVNSIKVFIIAAYMVSSLIVFIVDGKVEWVPGLCLAAGNSLGAYLGSTFSVKKGDKWIKVVLIVVIAAMSLKLLGVRKL